MSDLLIGRRIEYVYGKETYQGKVICLAGTVNYNGVEIHGNNSSENGWANNNYLVQHDDGVLRIVEVNEIRKIMEPIVKPLPAIQHQDLNLGWIETHYEVVAFIAHEMSKTNTCEKIDAIYQANGRTGLHDLARLLTSEFEETHSNETWGDGKDYFETIDAFLHDRLQVNAYTAPKPNILSAQVPAFWTGQEIRAVGFEYGIERVSVKCRKDRIDGLATVVDNLIIAFVSNDGTVTFEKDDFLPF